MASQHDWELSKENVQPLRQGRQMASLSTALNSDGEKEIKLMQNEFEVELRTYSGLDPFDVWDRYVKWTEQYFPKGGHDGHLMALIERCLKEFQDNDLYKSDARFIRVWIKFANASEEPVEVYSHMFDNGIGLNVAAFYCEWALSLERRKDYKGADAIYTEGINRLAQPKVTLLQMHQQFQQRLANQISLQIADDANPGMDFSDGGEERRKVLGKLKSSKKGQVGTTRTGGVSKGSAGFYKSSSSSVAKQVPSSSSKLSIFCDENSAPSVHLQQTNEWKSLPVRSDMNRENDKKPGVWTGAKVRQKGGSVSTQASFQIHEDEEPVEASETPRKTTLINNQPLSSRKPGKHMDSLSSLRAVQGVPNLNDGIPMYDKHRIYNGMHEFSFEELRAAEYFQNKKLMQEKAEQEATRRQNEELTKKMMEMTERMARMEAALLRNSRSESMESGDISGNRSVSSVSSANNESSQIPRELSRSQNASLNQSQRTPIFNSGTSYPNASLASSGQSQSSGGGNSFSRPQAANQPYKFPSNSSTSTRRQNSSVNLNESTRNSSFTNSFADQNNSRFNKTATPKSNGTTPESSCSFSRQGFVAPSPTVCTKEAELMIKQMFTSSFDNSMAASFDTSSTQGSQRGGAMPFQICEDRTQQLLLATDAAVGPQVYYDQENQGVASARKMTVNQENEIQAFPIFCDENEGVGTARKNPGLQIHCDESEQFSTVKKRVGLQVQSDPVSQSTNGQKKFGLQIYRDDIQEVEEIPTSNRKSVRRGLGFASSVSSMEDDDGMDHLMTINDDYTIEYQAKEDVTLAGLDKFTVLARAASTPFCPMKTPEQASESETSTAGSAAAASTFEGGLPPDTQHLSPILEGSGEESKSHASTSVSTSVSSCGSHTNATQISRHSSAPSHQPIDEEDADSSMIDGECLDATQGHLIDVSCYVPDSEQQDALSTSILVDSQNPFDDECIAKFLSVLDPPLKDYPNYSECNTLAPSFTEDLVILGNKDLIIEKQLGQGGYAKVYLVYEQDFESDDDDEEGMMTCTMSNKKYNVLKVQFPACPWEFYTSTELHTRLNYLHRSMDVTPSIVKVENGFQFRDASILEMPFLNNGSLLNLVNKYKSDRHLLAEVEAFACFLTVELLHMFEQIHACRVIHGDVKPDNFLLRNLPYVCENPSRGEVFGHKTQLVSLIDFGQSIDMSKFPPGTTFRAKVKTSGFQCIEMRTDRPWTYQTDLFGVAGTIHVVLLGSYMNVYQEKGQWRTTGSFNRKWNVPLWKEFFSTLLNIPSCHNQPDLAALRHKFEDYFLSKLSAYNTWVSDVKSSAANL